MRGRLREHTAVAGPGRHDVERQAEARARRRQAKRVVVRVEHPLARLITRRVRRHDVVRPAARLVVGEDVHGVVPRLAVEERLGDLALEPRAVARGVGRVLREVLRADDVRHLGQVALARILVELLKTRVGGAAAGELLLLLGRVLVLLELDERVVAKVVVVLVHLPGDAGLLQVLGHRLPALRVAAHRGAHVRLGAAGRVRVVDHRATELVRLAADGAAVRVDRASEPGDTVRVRRRDHTLKVRIAHQEVVRQRKVEGQVLPAVVADRVRRVVQRPAVVLAVVPRRVVLPPVVGAGNHALGTVAPVATLVVQVPRVQLLDVARRLRALQRVVHRLVPHRLVRVLRDVHVRVTEPTHAGHRTKVVVERAVLLHEENDVLHILQRAGRRRDRQRGRGDQLEQGGKQHHGAGRLVGIPPGPPINRPAA